MYGPGVGSDLRLLDHDQDREREKREIYIVPVLVEGVYGPGVGKDLRLQGSHRLNQRDVLPSQFNCIDPAPQ